MAKNIKVTIDDQTIKSIGRRKRREARQEAGLNDGRFNTRVVKSKKAYSRKEKHKSRDW